MYFLKFPSALVRRFKSKHVVAMHLSVTGTATYEVADYSGGGDGGTSNSYTLVRHTQTFNYTGDDEAAFGQGPRFGCFAVGDGPNGGGELTIGFTKYGQSCPKHL